MWRSYAPASGSASPCDHDARALAGASSTSLCCGQVTPSCRVRPALEVKWPGRDRRPVLLAVVQGWTTVGASIGYADLGSTRDPRAPQHQVDSTREASGEGEDTVRVRCASAKQARRSPIQPQP
ncbi:unnamed protein product [Urochloa humidicola]